MFEQSNHVEGQIEVKLDNPTSQWKMLKCITASAYLINIRQIILQHLKVVTQKILVLPEVHLVMQFYLFQWSEFWCSLPHSSFGDAV